MSDLREPGAPEGALLDARFLLRRHWPGVVLLTALFWVGAYQSCVAASTGTEALSVSPPSERWGAEITLSSAVDLEGNPIELEEPITFLLPDYIVDALLKGATGIIWNEEDNELMLDLPDGPVRLADVAEPTPDVEEVTEIPRR